MTEQQTAWDGVPEAPERDGWHWLRDTDGDCAFYWRASWRSWDQFFPDDYGPSREGGAAEVAKACTYLGPCLTPAEVAAKVEAEREAAISALAWALADGDCNGQDTLTDEDKAAYRAAAVQRLDAPVHRAAAIRARKGAPA